MKPRVIAFYLPQFHPISENDAWWGKGFTEWTNVKRDNKYSDGLKPLDDNFYNLLDIETVKWQTELMKEYGIYGFCYYHYWFKGKKLLEKPAENLLEFKDIDQNFCFCWANHSWYRSWLGSKELLIEQEYGTEEDWQEHFDYLKNFFIDKRYIKRDNKPVFIILNDFKQKENIIDYFNKKCREIRFNGIYIIESIGKPYDYSIYKKNKTILLREPDISYTAYIRHNPVLRLILKLDRLLNNGHNSRKAFKMRCINADKIFDISLNIFRKFNLTKNCYSTIFAMWDNTYRHNERGFKIYPSSQEDFVCYLKKTKEICENRELEFIFFNAWNEWAEGMTLEPSNIHRYRFLEGIREVFGEN